MPQPPRFLPLQPVPHDQMGRIPGLLKMKEYKSAFPKRALGTAAESRVAMRRWLEAQPVPTPVVNKEQRFQAVKVTAGMLKTLRTIAESEVAPAEILGQKLSEDEFYGSLYSALAAHEFLKMEGEYKRLQKLGRSLTKVDAEWRQVIQAGQMAFAAAGLKGLGAADLSRFARELASDSKGLNTVVKIANTGVASGASAVLDARTHAMATLVPTVERFVDLSTVATAIPDLCSKPISQGSFTKHFARSFSLSVRLKVWCPTWRKPFRTCWKTFTIAGVSFSLSLSVGYKVTCCGANAWGQAVAEACATVASIKVCASCAATITGVSGVGRTPAGSMCSYGVGITAALECKLFGKTVYYASVPFGWTVTGPCPPPGLCP